MENSEKGFFIRTTRIKKTELVGESNAYLDTTHGRVLAKYTAKTSAGLPDALFPDMFVTPEVHGRQVGFAVESIYHFVECIRDGKKPPTPGEDGLLNTRLILAAEESARTGKPADTET